MKNSTVVILIGLIALLLGGFIVTETNYFEDEGREELDQLDESQEPIVNSSRNTVPSSDGNMEEELDPASLR